nr:PREDICTED: coiled-coil domain-containing protein 110 isoform X4 [Anolis carolinensis]|eukprot:XP_008110011.1 PREDICTED: coiled-coil domain-containing protein 110 isoform X4 [Anolis carolinensis]
MGRGARGRTRGEMRVGVGSHESASGRDGQAQPHSPIKILQQQLESFQALRQQTLQNVSMVQCEINGILNKNIIDMKSSELDPDNLSLTSTPINIAMPRRYQEPSHFKKQLHFDDRPSTSFSTKTDSSTLFGDTITEENIPHHNLLKYKAIGKSEDHAQSSRNKPILSLNNDHELKNYMNNISSSSFISFKADDRPPLKEYKSYDDPKVPKVFPKFDDEDNECLTESVSFSFKDRQEESKRDPRHEPLYTFDFQNTRNVCSKDNDSGYLSEQDLTEKATNMPNEELKSRRISEAEGSADKFHGAMDSSQENNQNATQAAYDRKYSKETLMKEDAVDKLQLNFLSKAVVRDNLLFPEHIEDRHVEKEYPLLSSNHELQNKTGLEFCDAYTMPDEFGESVRLIQMPVKESEHAQKKTKNLEHENIDLRNQVKPLTDVIQSLTEQNIKYQKQIKDLYDDKNKIQERLVKSEGDCKECLKEVKRLLKKCKELQQQKATLEENQDQLYAQNQRIVEDINDFQKKNQKAQDDLAFFTKEKSDLIMALGSLEKQVAAYQEENKKLREEIGQLTETKKILETERGEKQMDIQKLKENEKATMSNLESLLNEIQSLKDEKLKLEETLQEALKVKEVLKKDLLEAQSKRADTEGKLMTECKTAKLEMGILNTNLSNTERECRKLGTMVVGITEDNWVLKKQLHEYKQEATEYKNKVRQLSAELLLMENEMRSAENERNVLKFEARRLQKNNAYLRDQVIALFNEQYKQRFRSHNQKGNYPFANSAEICDEISSYQHISSMHIQPDDTKTPTAMPEFLGQDQSKEKGLEEDSGELFPFFLRDMHIILGQSVLYIEGMLPKHLFKCSSTQFCPVPEILLSLYSCAWTAIDRTPDHQLFQAYPVLRTGKIKLSFQIFSCFIYIFINNPTSLP